MKILSFLICVFFLSISSIAQTKYYTKSGIIDFEASVPSFEEVKAKNSAVSCVINTDNGEIAALGLVKGFRFKVALMEEHFNENYAETEKFPKTSFSGKIANFSLEELSNIGKEFELSGKLTFHGETVEIREKATLRQNQDTLFLSTLFILNPEEFNMKFPSVIRKKIAEKVEVSIDFQLVPKN